MRSDSYGLRRRRTDPTSPWNVGAGYIRPLQPLAAGPQVRRR